MHFNLFDLTVLLVIGLSALLSFFRGFVREVLSLGGWLIASIITLRFIEPASAWVKPQVKSEMIATGIAAVGLFFVTLVTLSILANAVVKYLKPGDKMGLLDNLAGLAFGVARGALIVGIGFFILTIVMTEKNYPDIIKTAYSKPYAAEVAKWIAELTPDYLNKIANKGKDAAQKDGKALGKAHQDAKKSLQETLDETDTKIEDELPTIEDLQRQIKEENEAK